MTRYYIDEMDNNAKAEDLIFTHEDIADLFSEDEMGRLYTENFDNYEWMQELTDVSIVLDEQIYEFRESYDKSENLEEFVRDNLDSIPFGTREAYKDLIEGLNKGDRIMENLQKEEYVFPGEYRNTKDDYDKGVDLCDDLVENILNNEGESLEDLKIQSAESMIDIYDVDLLKSVENLYYDGLIDVQTPSNNETIIDQIRQAQFEGNLMILNENEPQIMKNVAMELLKDKDIELDDRQLDDLIENINLDDRGVDQILSEITEKAQDISLGKSDLSLDSKIPEKSR
ncbi:MAG: hypothetical protein Q4B52_03805 [Tissierellia bacterium]|nr:hypothetical protein [Tissierellia bacterium]